MNQVQAVLYCCQLQGIVTCMPFKKRAATKNHKIRFIGIEVLITLKFTIKCPCESSTTSIFGTEARC